MSSKLRVTFSPGRSCVSRQISKAKADITDCTGYYLGNARNTLKTAHRLSKIRQQSKPKSWATKFCSLVVKTKVRKKDIIPVFLAGVGTPLPFPGAAPLGFMLGQLINKVAKIGGVKN